MNQKSVRGGHDDDDDAAAAPEDVTNMQTGFQRNKNRFISYCMNKILKQTKSFVLEDDINYLFEMKVMGIHSNMRKQ